MSKSDTNVCLDGEEMARFNYRQSTGSPRCSNRRLSSGAHAVEGSKNARKRWSFVAK
ncbi:MAG: hypothetical protein ACR2N0_17765 [Rubrobacteraceae bacterium]